MLLASFIFLRPPLYIQVQWSFSSKELQYLLSSLATKADGFVTISGYEEEIMPESVLHLRIPPTYPMQSTPLVTQAAFGWRQPML